MSWASFIQKPDLQMEIKINIILAEIPSQGNATQSPFKARDDTIL
jgi:hypothetical protein